MARLGSIRHRATLLRLQPGLDDRGQPSGKWRRVGNVWAGLRPLTLKEQEQANRIYAIATYAMDVRYNPNAIPQPKDRIEWRRRTLEVGSAVNVEGRDREFTLLVSELT
jgi:SPP1 family predicted phage head-tail adaptor